MRHDTNHDLWADCWDRIADDRSDGENRRNYFRVEYQIENAVMALHYALMADHERSLIAEPMMMEQAA